VERVKPAVVNVAVKGKISEHRLGERPELKMPEPPEGSPFADLFRRFFEERGMPGGDDGTPNGPQAQGSGFIIDPSGYIVTNDHVVDGAQEITVILDDGSKHTARVKGRDPKTDLALIKIDAGRALPYVELGDSDGTKVGDWVIAVGNPFGLGGTVTAGIISARGRDLHSGPFDDYLQIDAPINRGNSGGPLFDATGRVIGVNTAIWSPSGGSVGIGFAVPSTLARSVVDQLMAHGSIARGWLGVQIQAVTPEVAESLGVAEEKGALVAAVTPESPAAKAGLRPGDLILSMDGKPLDDFKALPRLVAGAEPGQGASLEVLREGKTRDLSVTLGRTPGTETTASSDPSEATPARGQLGLQLAPLTPETKKRQGLPADAEGVLVLDVKKGSPASKAGIRAGSVVLMIDQSPVETPDALVKKVRQAYEAKRTSVLLLVEHEGDRTFVAVKLQA
jgi:serine protease Do